MSELDRLLRKLKVLVVHEKKKLCSREVVSVSEKIDKLILKEMLKRNQLELGSKLEERS